VRALSACAHGVGALRLRDCGTAVLLERDRPRSLHPHHHSTPPPPGCYLARRGWLHALRDQEVALFLASLFRAAADPGGWRAAGLLDGHSPVRTAFRSSSSSSRDSSSTFTSLTDTSPSNNARSIDNSTESSDDNSSSSAGANSMIEDSEARSTTTASTSTYTSTAAATSSCPPPSLSRHDLFHGHVFVSKAGGVGILMHAAECPRYDPWGFPLDLGYCQRDSRLEFNPRAMDLRNIVFYEVSGRCFERLAAGFGAVAGRQLSECTPRWLFGLIPPTPLTRPCWHPLQPPTPHYC